MATYENGYEEKEESAQMTEDDLAYKDKYEDHQSVLNLLSSCQEADHDNREMSREAHLFLDKRDGQWEAYWWEANQNKPRYTFDNVNPIVDQVASEIEQADFDIRVSPAGGNATKDIASTYDGLIRNIENISNAKQVYSQAARGMVTGGFDAWRVSQKFADDNSFDQEGVTEVRRRTRKVHKVCSRFFDNKDWLEDDRETVFNRIPVIPVYGNYKIFEGKTLYWGVVEKLLDPQRVLNYAMSRSIEEGALAPRAKYWMTPAQAAGHEDQLGTLNTNSDPVQFFNPDPEFPSIPQQQGGAQVNQGLSLIAQSMQGMINATAGMFAANMGDNPNAQSGVAIRQLQNKGDNGTFKYSRAMEIAIAATGRLIKDAIPKVYDTARTVRVLREDESYDMADLNQQVIDNATGEIVVINDLSVGSYDVICKAGPSFRNRQEETIEAIVSLAQVDPSIMQIAGDLMLQSVNTPAASQIAERKRAQMLQQGLIPQSQMTEEEIMEMQQAQMMAQGQQAPDPAMVLAQAEQLKAEAEMMRSQIEMQKLQNEQMKLQLEAQKLQSQAVGDQADNAIDAFNAETKRMETQIKAQQASATVDKTSAQAMGEQLDNQKKMSDMMEEQMMKSRIPMMSEAELISLANRR
jgi:hypothetical protein